jgi:type II secretory pathway component PulC
MRQPLWAINSSLLFFGILGQLVFFFLQTPMVRRTSLEPDTIPLVNQKAVLNVDTIKIYGVNDLFATYVPSVVEPKALVPTIPVMPTAPGLIPLSIPLESPKVFIAPLPVTLKGVMYVHDRPSQSVAIIQFQDSKEEINYHSGQLINDAQILKIYPNRIIVVRSNGQRETLYLRQDDAGKDLARDSAAQIATLHIAIKSGAYQIPVTQLTKQIKGLGQFIDLLDLTTVYKKGKSIGCRVGKADKDTLAAKLGLMYDDVIQQIDGLPITDVASRILAFDHTITKQIGDTITVHIERSGKSLTLKYELIDSPDSKTLSISVKTPTTPSQPAATAPVISPEMLYNIEEERKRTLEQKVKFAPTAHQLAAEERKKMFQARHKDLIANKPTSSGSTLSLHHNSLKMKE